MQRLATVCVLAATVLVVALFLRGQWFGEAAASPVPRPNDSSLSARAEPASASPPAVVRVAVADGDSGTLDVLVEVVDSNTGTPLVGASLVVAPVGLHATGRSLGELGKTSDKGLVRVQYEGLCSVGYTG